MGISQRTRFVRFAICEAIAIAILLSAGAVGVHERNANRIIRRRQAPLSWLVTTLTISSAVAAGLIPIIFFGPERLR